MRREQSLILNKKFGRGDRLGRIERDRNGNPTLVEHDGWITKLKGN